MISLLDLPQRRAVALLGTGVPVFFPIDPVEYHGPHLSLHNDHLIAMGIARDLHAELVRTYPGASDWPFVSSANLELGVEPAQGPGTRNAPLGDVRRAVVEAAHALADLGARRVVFTTFHGSPLHSTAIQAGVEALLARGVRAISPMNVLFRDQITMEPEAFTPAVAHVPERERDAVLAELPCDFHAGMMETSIALHYAPDSVDPIYLELPDCPTFSPDATFERASRAAAALGQTKHAKELHYAALGVGWSKLRPFLGYTGRPRLASAEAGAYFARFITERATPAIRATFDGAPPPEPIMKWLSTLTLGGRLPGADTIQRA